MKHSRYFWFWFVIITILSWIDHQYFTEGHAEHFSPFVRQVAHIIILISIIPAGYMGWKDYPIHWFSKIWLYSYLFITLFIGFVGLLHWKFQLFPIVPPATENPFLDSVSSYRLFFCSPVPYFMLYILHKVITRTGHES